MHTLQIYPGLRNVLRFTGSSRRISCPLTLFQILSSTRSPSTRTPIPSPVATGSPSTSTRYPRMVTASTYAGFSRSPLPYDTSSSGSSVCGATTVAPCRASPKTVRRVRLNFGAMHGPGTGPSPICRPIRNGGAGPAGGDGFRREYGRLRQGRGYSIKGGQCCAFRKLRVNQSREKETKPV